MRKLLVSAVVLVVAAYAVGALVFLEHDDDELDGSADAVVVLAGDDSRLPVALDLVREGAARVLVVSADTSGEDEARAAFCRTGRVPGVEVLCPTARPFSTRGEARMVAALADRRRWDELVVVTSRYHLFRTGRLFRRCTDARLVLRGSDESWFENLRAIPLEWAKLGVAETIRRGC